MKEPEDPLSGLEMGTRKEPCAQLSHSVLPPHSSLLSLLPNVFLRGSPLGPSVLCFETPLWQDPQQVPVPSPAVLVPAGQGQPSMEGRGRGVISHTQC